MSDMINNIHIQYAMRTRTFNLTNIAWKISAYIQNGNLQEAMEIFLEELRPPVGFSRALFPITEEEYYYIEQVESNNSSVSVVVFPNFSEEREIR